MIHDARRKLRHVYKTYPVESRKKLLDSYVRLRNTKLVHISIEYIYIILYIYNKFGLG